MTVQIVRWSIMGRPPAELCAYNDWVADRLTKAAWSAWTTQGISLDEYEASLNTFDRLRISALAVATVMSEYLA